jgi:hypothetical protein
MKTLLLLLLFPSISFAKCWIAKDLNDQTRLKIEFRTQPPMYPVAECPVDDSHKLVGNIEDISKSIVEEDDLFSPIFEKKSNVTACEGIEICRELIAEKCIEDVCEKYCPDSYQAYINEDYSEAYCTRVIGHNKKQVEQYVYDPTKRASRLASEQANRAAAEAKKQAGTARMNRIKAGCISATGLLKEICEEISGDK